MTLQNKRSVSFISALLIMVFHLWVTISKSQVETYIRTISYVGVDMFFLISAMSLGSREITDYKGFIMNRFKHIYLKFVLFAIVAFIYKKWDFIRLLKVLSGVELLVKGGGSFLWFLPAIMIIYLVMPFYQKADLKNRFLTLGLTMIAYFFIGVLVSNLTTYKGMWIWYNRLPIILIGYYLAVYKDKLKINIFVTIGLVIIGGYLAYLYGYKAKLNMPMREFYYVAMIPLTLGLVKLADYIPENKVINDLGSATLEMYALQMIFGPALVLKLMKMMPAIACNIVSFMIIIVVSVVINQLLRKVNI